jgi:hypothetical protein
VAVLRDVFVHCDISVLYNPIPRTLSPSVPPTSQNPVVNGDVNAVDPDSLQVSESSEEINPILYVGTSTRALTNILLTHPTTPVRTRFRSPRAPYSGDTILFICASRSMNMTLQRDRRPFSLQNE